METENTKISKQSIGFLLLAVISTFLGISAFAGLFWSRWLRPFNRLSLIAYCLCWLSITVIPITQQYIVNSNHFERDNLLAFGAYLLSACIWLAIHRFFIRTPSRSVAQAILTSIGGTLFLAVAVVPGGQTFILLPLNVGIVIDSILVVKGTINLEHWSVASAVYLGGLVIPALLIFFAHFLVYWPSRTPDDHTRLVKSDIDGL